MLRCEEELVASLSSLRMGNIRKCWHCSMEAKMSDHRTLSKSTPQSIFRKQKNPFSAHSFPPCIHTQKDTTSAQRLCTCQVQRNLPETQNFCRTQKDLSTQQTFCRCRTQRSPTPSSSPRSPCVHLCIIGKKVKLHRRQKEDNSFYTRLRNHLDRIKQRQQRAATTTTSTTSTTMNTTAATAQRIDPRRHPAQSLQRLSPNGHDLPANSNSDIEIRLPDILNGPEMRLSRRSSDRSIDGKHTYMLYRSNSVWNEALTITVTLPSDIPTDRPLLRDQRPSFTYSLGSRSPCGSGCASHLSFSNVDFSTCCKTPDENALLQPIVKSAQLYPVACPAIPMEESFPVCEIPEPDIW